MNNESNKLAKFVQEFTYEESAKEKEYAKEVKIKSGESAVLRFLDGSDNFKSYQISWIMCDDDMIRPFIVKNESEGSSILGRMLGDPTNFCRGGFLESKRGAYGQVFTYKAKDPELFNIMTNYFNPAFNGTGTSRPSIEAIYNVIHRNPEYIDTLQKEDVWCKVFKKTKVVRFKVSSMTALNNVESNNGSLVDYDIIYEKINSGGKVVTQIMKVGIKTPYAVTGPVTEEEQAYERWDLNNLIRLSSAHYILTHLRSKVERISSAMNIDFYGELVSQEKLEFDEYQKIKAQQKTESTNPIIINSPTVGTKSAATPAIETPRTQEVTPKVITRNPIHRSAVKTEAMTVCGHCHKEVPESAETCPHCQQILKIECDNCGAMMGYFEEVCPSCGAKYSLT